MFFGFFEDTFIVGDAVGDEVMNDARQFVRGRRDRFWRAEFGFHAAIEGAKNGLIAFEGEARHAQGGGEPAFDGTGFRAEHAIAGDAIVGAETHPGSEVARRWEASHVRADFA